MANNVIQVKRTSISGRAANTTTIPNAGELGLNMADGILYSTNGTFVFEVGANNTNVNITGNATIKAIVANGTIGTAGQMLTSNGSVVYWSTPSGGGGGSVNVDSTYAWTNAHTFTGNVSFARVIANGSSGSSGQVLTSNGSSTYWSTSSGGGSVTIIEQEIDFGATPVYSKSFSLTIPATIGQKVMITPSSVNAYGRGIDGFFELEMDNFICSGAVFDTDSVIVSITAVPGPVANTRNFNLIIG